MGIWIWGGEEVIWLLRNWVFRLFAKEGDKRSGWWWWYLLCLFGGEGKGKEVEMPRLDSEGSGKRDVQKCRRRICTKKV